MKEELLFRVSYVPCKNGPLRFGGFPYRVAEIAGESNLVFVHPERGYVTPLMRSNTILQEHFKIGRPPCGKFSLDIRNGERGARYRIYKAETNERSRTKKV